MKIGIISVQNTKNANNQRLNKVSFGIGGRCVYDDDCELNWSNGWGPVPYYKKTSFDFPFGYEYDDDCQTNWSNGWGPRASRSEEVRALCVNSEKRRCDAERARRRALRYPAEDTYVRKSLPKSVRSVMD